MPERKYLGIIPLYGTKEVVEGKDLVEVDGKINKVIEKAKQSYPLAEFEKGVVIYNARPIGRKERKFLDAHRNSRQ